MLIDLNEEIFAISEEMASAFSSNRQKDGKDLYKRAQEFEQKKVKIFSKIRNTISTNPLVKMVKGERETGKENTNISHSPPQRDNPV